MSSLLWEFEYLQKVQKLPKSIRLIPMFNESHSFEQQIA